MVSTVPGVGAGSLRAQGWSSIWSSDACCSEKAPVSWPGALALGLCCLGLNFRVLHFKRHTGGKSVHLFDPQFLHL